MSTGNHDYCTVDDQLNLDELHKLNDVFDQHYQHYVAAIHHHDPRPHYHNRSNHDDNAGSDNYTTANNDDAAAEYDGHDGCA